MGRVAVDPARRPVRRRRGRRLRYEVMLGLELSALTSFAFARPLLDSFGRSPETFVARGANTTAIVAFCVAVVAVPAVAAAVTGLATHLMGKGVRRMAHLLLVAVLAGVGAWRLGQDLRGWSTTDARLVAGGIAAGLAAGAVRRFVPLTSTFLRFAALAGPAFAAHFLFLSPTAALVLEDRPSLDPDVARAVEADLGDDPAPVVVVVFDAFPTIALLDGSGAIDRDVFPNIAGLADTATWYRNASTVSAMTENAVPAIATGRYPDPAGPRRTPDPHNLFTLLGGSYDLHVREQVTRLCPRDLCPSLASGGLGRLLRDAAELWAGGAATSVDPEGFHLPAAMGDDRYQDAERFAEGVAGRRDGRPQLSFLHAILPHYPWRFLPDGTLYAANDDLPTGFFGNGWTEAGVPVGRQRFLLQAQAADAIVGRVLDRLRADGSFDDALVVVTADHGEAFDPDLPSRVLHEENVASILWTPLIVKAPGQVDGGIDDANVESVDVLPTIAAELGVELPWEVDGRPASDAASRDPDVKIVQPDEKHGLRPDGDGPWLTVDARAGFDEVLARRLVEGTGPDAVWRRTPHGGLFGAWAGDLEIGRPLGDVIRVENLHRLRHVDTGAPLPLEVVGRGDLEVGAVVAYALNGTIGALTVTETFGAGPPMVHGLLPPDLFVDGANELTAYVVEGPPGGETLRPVTVEARD